MTISSYDIVRAYKKNCPHVRLTRDEELELSRLVHIYAEQFAISKALARQALPPTGDT